MDFIYHIFPARNLHLSPHIIKSIIRNSTICQHKFIIWQCDQNNRNIYSRIQDEYGVSIMFANTLYDLRKLLLDKNIPIILHSIIIECCFYLFINRFNNSTLVFWGSGLNTQNVKHKILLPCKRILFNFFRFKIALMEPDKYSLETQFHQKNVEVIPYLGEREQITESYLASTEERCINVIPQIYIGNNTSCMSDYLNILQNTLYKFRSICHITFMMNYDLNEDIVFHNLIQFCSNHYACWKVDRTLYSLSEYVKYIDRCSIYICGTERQTGLGAIYTCLKLGKKVYLTGKNYQWIKSLGCHIFKVEDITKMTYEEFISPLKDNEIHQNYTIMSEFEDISTKAEKWESLFHRILS